MQSNHTVNRSANQLGDVEIVLRRLARLHLSGSAVALACLLAERGPSHRVNMAEISRTLGVSRTALYRALGALRSAGILNGDDRIIPEGATPGVTDQHNGEVQPRGSQMQPRGERNPRVDSVTPGVAQPPGLQECNPGGNNCNPLVLSLSSEKREKDRQTDRPEDRLAGSALSPSPGDSEQSEVAGAAGDAEPEDDYHPHAAEAYEIALTWGWPEAQAQAIASEASKTPHWQTFRAALLHASETRANRAIDVDRPPAFVGSFYKRFLDSGVPSGPEPQPPDPSRPRQPRGSVVRPAPAFKPTPKPPTLGRLSQRTYKNVRPCAEARP